MIGLCASLGRKSISASTVGHFATVSKASRLSVLAVAYVALQGTVFLAVWVHDVGLELLLILASPAVAAYAVGTAIERNDHLGIRGGVAVLLVIPLALAIALLLALLGIYAAGSY